MSKQVTLGEHFQKQTFEAIALQVPGGHFLIFTYLAKNYSAVFLHQKLETRTRTLI